MIKWLLIGGAVVVLGAGGMILLGNRRESAIAERLVKLLTQSTSRPTLETVDFNALADLPPPVQRYFRHVLTPDQRLIRTARIQQSGTLRTSTKTGKWSAFTACHLIVPPVNGFVWNARVTMPLATHVRVLDSYIEGTGSGRVSLLSTIAVASEAGAAELNSGALYRYLAEAVWYPTALLPQSGVVWHPIDEHAAMATLTDSVTTVRLEFRFNEIGEITGMYSSDRYGRFEGEYRQAPWEGHFDHYQACQGMRIPLYGEVGWYDGGILQVVWKGNLIDVRYEFPR